MGAFFQYGLFCPNPHGPWPSPLGWAKLTPPIKTFKKFKKLKKIKFKKRKLSKESVKISNSRS